MIWGRHVAHKAELRNAYIVRLQRNYHLEYIDRFEVNTEKCVW
jgi:hypothetical protein